MTLSPLSCFQQTELSTGLQGADPGFFSGGRWGRWFARSFTATTLHMFFL